MEEIQLQVGCQDCRVLAECQIPQRHLQTELDEWSRRVSKIDQTDLFDLGIQLNNVESLLDLEVDVLLLC